MTRSRRIFLVLGLLIVIISLLLIHYMNADLGQYPVEEMPRQHLPEDMKTILYWTGMWGARDFYLGSGTKIFENCTYKNCYATYHRNQFPVEKFDAVIFHGSQDKFSTPDKRNPNQVYIYVNLESPMYTPRFAMYDNFYNWTMTYRMDSDIFRPYGFFEKKKTDYQPPSAQEIQKRPKKIAWLVSHCRTSSERESLTNKIQQYVPVDVYGSCGVLNCSRNAAEECYNIMETNYKFYFSFENSVCEDYVTEKLYNILNKDIVPIVYGGADYDTMTPPKSVINVLDFKSVKDLVAYIRHLDTHPEEYLEFFEWKKDYVVKTHTKPVVCTLCQKLNEPIKPKVYTNLENWWNGENFDKCSTNFIQNFF